MSKLKEAISSLKDARKKDSHIYCAPVAIKELQEFLTAEALEPTSEPLELRALYA